jgi:ADP-ribose pyrophosphatase
MADQETTAFVHEVQEIHTGRVFSLQQERVTLPNGLKTSLEIIRHPGAAAIVPMLGDTEILLLRQYRHAVGRFIWEIPAGTLSRGEAPLQCAKRELQEETGYAAQTFHLLGEVVPVPGYSDERVFLYLARNLRKAYQNLDDDEVLTVKTFSLEDALRMIHRGEIVDAKTVIGLLKAQAYLQPPL